MAALLARYAVASPPSWEAPAVGSHRTPGFDVGEAECLDEEGRLGIGDEHDCAGEMPACDRGVDERGRGWRRISRGGPSRAGGEHEHDADRAPEA